MFAGQYRVERVLGSGGMGVVLAAWDEQNARGIALKVLQVTDPTSVARFHREARQMKKLSSDHVVKVIDSGTVDETVPFLVMERLVGANLSEYLKANGGKLAAGEVADIVIQACEALAHAHAAGIVHRDVKPSNLYVHDDKGRRVVKVLDFGISKQLSREEWEKTLTETAEGGVLGSPPYMSPEHVRDPKNVDLRADIWALGVLLHKLSVGSLPFDGDSVGEIFAKVLEAKPPPMPDLPPRLRAVIERCLSRDRNGRYPSTLALAEALAPMASPEIAGMVSRIPLSAAQNDEPSTLTVDHPPPIFTGPAVVPSSVTPPAAAIPMPQFAVLPSPEKVKSRRLLAVGLAVAGIAIGVVIGAAVRRVPAATASTGQPPAQVAEVAPPTTAPVAQSTAQPSASVTLSAAPIASTSPSGSAPVPGSQKRVKPRGTPASSKGTAPAASSPPVVAAPVVTTTAERSELQDNPYKKKPPE